MSERRIVIENNKIAAMEYTPAEPYTMAMLTIYLEGGADIMIYDSDPDFAFYKAEFDRRYNVKVKTQL